MTYQPIENYGIIGNMRTVALVGMNGSIDWYCYPYFDSPSIFGAILDDNKGGRFQICPVGDQVRLYYSAFAGEQEAAESPRLRAQTRARSGLARERQPGGPLGVQDVRR